MSEREWRFYLDDMIGFAEKILAYTQGFDQASGLTYDATLRNLELLASNNTRHASAGFGLKRAPRWVTF